MTDSPVRILIVEDEALIALVAEDMLAELGYRDVAVASSIEEALGHIAAQPVDFALLDVNIKGRNILPVAEELRRRAIPFAFASGASGSDLPPGMRDYPALTKPYRLDELQRLMAERGASAGSQDRISCAP